MDSKILQCSLKLKKLLRKILEPNFQVRSNGDLNVLLSHLAKDPELGEKMLGLDLFNDWIVQACSYWEKNVIQPSPDVCTFTLELLGLISKNEQKFRELNRSNIHSRLTDTMQITDDSMPSINLAFVKLLSSLLEHKSGYEWIVAKNMWSNVLAFCVRNSTNYIVRDNSTFMYRLLEKAAEYDEQFLNSVIKMIMQPLMINELRSTVNIDEEYLKDKLTPTLRLIVFIMEQYCSNKCTQKGKQRIPTAFLRNYRLEHVLSSYMLFVTNEDFIFELENATILMYFAVLCGDAREPAFYTEHLKGVGIKVFKLIALDISKHYNLNVIKVCYLFFRYLNLVKQKFPLLISNSEESLVTLEKKINVFQFIPMYMVSMNICSKTMAEFEINEFRANYLSKIFDILCLQTVRLGYSWRNQLLAEKHSFEIAVKSISYLMQSRQYYSKEMAFMVFQTILYSIEDLVSAMKSNQQLIDTCIRESTYLYVILDAVAKMIEDFQITWRDCVETISVMGTAIDLINLAQWPPKVVVQALKVVNLSISKYMSPNLALLVDRTYDSAMDMLGPLLTNKLQDEHWEVRDTALEVLCTVSEIAHTKFPSFQSIVLQRELPKLVTDMCASDCQSFVRASALKCLLVMIVVPAFWFEALNNVEILKKLRNILNEETEAIVRSEAAALVVKIYRCHSFPEEIRKQMYELMAYSATTDLHWEVKIKALEFWDTVIQEELKNQGMIDGSFPSVTFSKENRKIVTLTDAEVQRRLNKGLLQLSDCGCLGVLVSAIQDDCDVEVVKQAVDITKKLIQLTKRYKVCSTTCRTYERTCSTTSSCGSAEIMVTATEETTGNLANCEKGLIESAGLSTTAANVPFGNCCVKSVKIIPPTDFMDFVQQDLDELVNARKKWLNSADSFSSILDNMLKSYDKVHENTKSMDCY